MTHNDPAKVFTCATCKRVRPRGQRLAGVNRCRDKASCMEAATAWLVREQFANGAAVRAS